MMRWSVNKSFEAEMIILFKRQDLKNRRDEIKMNNIEA